VRRKIKYIILHCTDSLWGEVDEVRHWHKQRGFDDIGYHYLICNRYPYYWNLKENKPDPLFDGVVQKGRSEDIPGAHTKGKNSLSIGVALVGTTKFTASQFESLKFLLKSLMEKYNLSVANIRGHYEFNPNKTCPNIVMNTFRAELREYLTKRKIKDKKERYVRKA